MAGMNKRKPARDPSDAPLAQLPPAMAGACAAMLRDHLRRLRSVGQHHNRLLHYDQLLAAHLLGFFDSTVRSLRTLDARSVTAGSMREALADQRLARSTISDAMGELPAAALLPLLQELLKRLPANCSHPDLQDLLTLKKRICAIDGSYFRVPADVLWALAHRRSNGKIGRQVRLDLHLDVLAFVPVDARVDGADEASEPASFAGMIQPGRVYLADRNFVDFDFLAAVLKAPSDFVVRLKNNPHSINMELLEPCPVSPADADAGVLEDQPVKIPGTRWSGGLGQRVLRVVTVWDPVSQKPVRLLTSLLEVPAALVGKLYRHRWAIELFFKWLKCVAKVKHLFSESANGMTMQFYGVIIATLLLTLSTGSRPSVYSFVMLSSAARGDLVLEKVPEVLERIARERELERRRRAKARTKSV
jgi:hypothetical protein